MSTERDANRIVRSWLEEGVTALPDRVLDTVLDQLPATPQRRPWWPARRFREMNSKAKFAIGAAAVVAVAFVGGRIMAPAGAGPGPGGPAATPSSSPPPSPTPTASIQRLGQAALDPGLVIATGFGASESVTFTFTVPDGWVGFSGVGVLPATGTEAPDGMGIILGEANLGLFSDPCDWASAETVPVGPTVDDLAETLAEQTGYEASSPVDASLGGYSGKRIDLTPPVGRRLMRRRRVLPVDRLGLCPGPRQRLARLDPRRRGRPHRRPLDSSPGRPRRIRPSSRRSWTPSRSNPESTGSPDAWSGSRPARLSASRRAPRSARRAGTAVARRTSSSRARRRR